MLYNYISNFFDVAPPLPYPIEVGKTFFYGLLKIFKNLGFDLKCFRLFS